MSSDLWRKAIAWCKTSVWAFPAVLLFILLILSAGKISGSSVGTYHPILYGSQSHDPNLLYALPRELRSDEWVSATQMTIAQSKTGYHKANPLMGVNGTDVSLQSEVPSKDWSTVFKPLNWIYFILPVEFAFAFKWWLMMFALMTACYFLTLRLLSDKRFAIIFSIAIGLSPFALWWYQSTIFAGLTYAFLMMILTMRVLNGERFAWIRNRKLSYALHGLAFAFVAACFGIILYPPFQIPIAIATAAFLVGYLLQKRFDEKPSWRILGKRSLTIIGGAVLAGIVGLGFIETHKSTIDNLTHTLYPGARVAVSGQMPMLQVFDAFLMPPLQGFSRGAHFFTNASEASNFILLMPFLLLPCFALIWYEFKKFRRIDWTFLAVQLTGLLFLARGFLPFGNSLYKILLLQDVPDNGRLVIGMGLVGILQIILLVKKLRELKIRRTRLMPYALMYGLSCFIVLLWAGFFVRTNYPLFVHSWLIIIPLALFFTAIITAFIANRPTVAVCLFLLFTLASSYRIIPLYHGLGFAAGNAVTQAMDSISKPTDRWSTVDSIVFENMSILADRPSVTGAQNPNAKFWQQSFGKQYNQIYNREAHIILTDDPSVTAPLHLVQGDYFQIKLACTPFIETYVQYALAISPLEPLPCLKQMKTVRYPNVTFYLYKISTVPKH